MLVYITFICIGKETIMLFSLTKNILYDKGLFEFFPFLFEKATVLLE
jgi:hypothetical protein